MTRLAFPHLRQPAVYPEEGEEAMQAAHEEAMRELKVAKAAQLITT